MLEGDGQLGLLRPIESDINFAIPSADNLRKFTPYDSKPVERLPGTFTDVIDDVASALNGTSTCVSFDGKKLKQGLTATSGDVDLLGFEKGSTLMDRRRQLSERMELVKGLCNRLQKADTSTDLHLLSVDVSNETRQVLLDSLQILAVDAIDIRALQKKKEYALEKFIMRGGQEWRQGRFAFVISAIKAFLYDIQKYLKAHTQLIQDICKTVAYVNKEIYSDQLQVHLPSNNRFRDVENNTSQDECRKIKQRSKEWFEARENAVVTGSTIYSAVGLDGLKRMREHFDTKVCSEKRLEPSQAVKDAMQYGTDNEINATSTLVGVVLPVIAPSCFMQEEGYINVALTENGGVIGKIIVSPDGSVCDENGTVYGVEFKCPVNAIHTEVLHRYYLQCQATMLALDTQRLLYLCWRPDSSTVFEVYRDHESFSAALEIVLDVYLCDKKKRPTKLPESHQNLRDDIEKGRKRCRFIGEFPSAIASDLPRLLENVRRITTDDTLKLLEQISQSFQEGYHLKREKATEAVVFLCSDLDRCYNKSALRWAPINWFPKGYSLTSEVMREIMESVLNECKERGLHVPAISFDGQWHNISTRSLHGEPLTLLQLLRDTWKEAEQRQKSEIVKEFSELNKDVQTLNVNGTHCLSNGGIVLPFIPSNALRKPTQTEQGKDAPQEEVLATNVIPESVILNGISSPEARIVSNLTLNETQAAAISECNVDEEMWSRVLDEEFDDEARQASTTRSYPDLRDLFETNNTPEEQQISLPHETLISTDDMNILLALLQTDGVANKKGVWNTKTSADLMSILSDGSKLCKLLNTDLKVVVRFMKNRFKEAMLKESDSKEQKLRKLCSVLNLNNPYVPRQRCTKKSTTQPKRLSVLSKTVLMSPGVPKKALNVSYAQYKWKDRLCTWRSKARIEGIKVDGLGYPDFWFSVPEFNETRNQLELKSVDATHLFTRLRRHSCKGHIEGTNKDAWMKVAKEGNTFLSPVMVDDVIDPMSVAMARTHFSEPVEDGMRRNGDVQCANFCQDVRRWWIANDDPGISANARIGLRSQLRNRLLSGIDFISPTFPPPTSYIRGVPIQLWEALLVDIDSKCQLYALTRSGTFNVRAFSSMMGETFFSDLTQQDSRGHGAVTCEDFQRYLGQAVEQMNCRLDDERLVCFTFYF